MRKTRTRLIIWFLIVIGLTAVAIVVPVNKSLSRQFETFIISTSEGQVNTLETFVIEEYRDDGWKPDFENRLVQLAEVERMSVRLLSVTDEVLVDFKYEEPWEQRRRSMPMHMHRDWKDDFEDYWPTRVIRILRTENGDQIGLLEIELHALDDAMEPAMDFQKNMTRGIVKAVIIAAGLSIILALIFARTFSKPLRDMTKVAESMKSGDLEKRVSVKQNTFELQKMAFALNHLSESLEIQQSLRSRLASDLSHELRTPLSVIKSHIEAIRDGIWSLDDTRIDILLRETERLMNLADQVRYIEDVESHQINLNLQDVELKSWLENIAEYFRPEFKKQNKSFEIIGDPAHIKLDADKFKQIIINLMTNALQHTSSGDSITLTIEKTATGVLLNVTDTGVGIAAKDLEHIFERLYRSEEARSRVNGGTGLGLSVVKSLVEAHGFTIIAKSKAGRGTTLSINMIE